MCTNGKIDIDENGNIIENEKLLDHNIFQNFHAVLREMKKTVGIDLYVFQKVIDDTNISKAVFYMCNNIYGTHEYLTCNFKLPNSQHLLLLKNLKEQYPEIITIISEKDYITVQELETY